MTTKYILAALSVVFLVLGASGALRERGPAHPQHRTWLLVGLIFAAISAWLFYRG